MTREEAKNLFRTDKDSYGKPRKPITKIDMIYDDFERILNDEIKLHIEVLKKYFNKEDYFIYDVLNKILKKIK